MKRVIFILFISFSLILNSCNFNANKESIDDYTKGLIEQYFTSQKQNKIYFLLSEIDYSDEYNEESFGVTYPTITGAGITIYLGTFDFIYSDKCSEETKNNYIELTVLHELCHVIAFEHSLEGNLLKDGFGHSEEWIRTFARVVKDYSENKNYTFSSCYKCFIQSYTDLSFSDFCKKYDM